jgi:polysaccharide deacetylase family protein (PEP-CTERM system associated)
LRGNSAIALTVDVEDYFHVEAFAGFIDRQGWERYSPRVEGNTDRLLRIFEKFDAKGTFFILGWVAERFPDLVRRISSAGHEIGSHGYNHRMATTMTPEEFRRDVGDSKKILEDILGSPVHGYRAPTFSINDKTPWAYEILLREGYRYSTSVFPVRHDRYGWPGFGLLPREMASDGELRIWEIPMSVARVGSANIPFGGGGYLRAYPLALTKALFRFACNRGQNGVFYVHPWEIDKEQPPVIAPFLNRLRHGQGISGTEGKIEGILESFGVCRVADHLHAAMRFNAIPKVDT